VLHSACPKSRERTSESPIRLRQTPSTRLLSAQEQAPRRSSAACPLRTRCRSATLPSVRTPGCLPDLTLAPIKRGLPTGPLRAGCPSVRRDGELPTAPLALHSEPEAARVGSPSPHAKWTVGRCEYRRCVDLQESGRVASLGVSSPVSWPCGQSAGRSPKANGQAPSPLGAPARELKQRQKARSRGASRFWKRKLSPHWPACADRPPAGAQGPKTWAIPDQ
jgi:hypothetical protein